MLNTITALRTWNSIVGKRLAFVGETPSHFLFVHPTKGKRRVSKRRVRPQPAAPVTTPALILAWGLSLWRWC